MFSSRLDWSVRPNPLAQLLEAKRSAGEKIIDLTQSNPTQAGIQYPEAEIMAALANPRAIRYEPHAAGLESAREAVSAYYADRGVRVDPGQVLLTASTSEAYAYAFKLLCNPGDQILAPRPSYPLFEYLAALERVRVAQYPLFYDHGWHIDIAALRAAIGPRTRAVVVVNPNNPTGSYLKRREFEELCEICREHDLALISDEVFSDYPLVPCHTDYVTTVAGATGVTAFAMSGLSKVAGLPQMKLAWMVANQPGAFERLELIADTYLSVGGPVQVALPALMSLRREIQARIASRTNENLVYLKHLVSADELQAEVYEAEAGWNVILRMPRTRSEEQRVLDSLSRTNILVQPGFFYDFESEAFLVVSLLCEPVTFRAGVRSIVAE
jgi:alanine-synthesizing transaminase